VGPVLKVDDRFEAVIRAFPAGQNHTLPGDRRRFGTGGAAAAAGQGAAAERLRRQRIRAGRRGHGHRPVPSPAPGTPPSGSFTYQALGQGPGYQLNVKTTNYPASTYTLSFTAGSDPTTHTAQFVVS
jgi:hypothetical protein